MTRRTRSLLAVAALATALGASGCGGGSSDTAATAGAAKPSGPTTNLNLVAYSVPKVGFAKVIPAFQKSSAGANVTFAESYGASGDQSRKVAAGARADIVSFSVEPDIARLVTAGVVDATWNKDSHAGVPFGSVVVMVVRKGNPKGIHDWDDLLKPGIEVITPNPLSSGSAKWNLLAPYAAKSNGGADAAAGLAFVTSLIKEHVKTQPASGSEATQTFVGGTGDVLLSYENEAISTERQGAAVEHIVPPTTFKIENPLAVTKNSAHPDQAKAFQAFQYTTAGQTAWAQAGFRPVDTTVAGTFSKDFPTPTKLWTIADLGGWAKVDPTFFDKTNGSISKVYNGKTG